MDRDLWWPPRTIFTWSLGIGAAGYGQTPSAHRLDGMTSRGGLCLLGLRNIAEAGHRRGTGLQKDKKESL